MALGLATSSLYCADNTDLEAAGSSLSHRNDVCDYSDEDFEPGNVDDVEENSSGNFMTKLAHSVLSWLVFALEESNIGYSSGTSSEGSSRKDSDAEDGDRDSEGKANVTTAYGRGETM